LAPALLKKWSNSLDSDSIHPCKIFKRINTNIKKNEGNKKCRRCHGPVKYGVRDFTCPDTLAACQVNQAVIGPDEVANEAERRKMEKYRQSWQFIPIAIETLGPIGRRIVAVTLHEITVATTGCP
jgi:hypothetical protein